MARSRQPANSEQPLEEAIRSLVIAAVQSMGRAEAAKRLDLTPTGVQRLVWARDLSLDEALHFADQLGLPVRQEMDRTLAASNG